MKILVIFILLLMFVGSCTKEVNLAPTCKIILPKLGEYSIGDSIAILVDASDPEGVLTNGVISVDGNVIFTIQVFPFMAKWHAVDIEEGQRKLKLTVKDEKNLTAEEEINLRFVKLETDFFIDSRDNKKYKTVKIGNKIWMAENLAYLPMITRYNSVSLDPCYYVYGYMGESLEEAKSTLNYKKYGVLYNWAAAYVSCPPGWRLASNNDWEEMALHISSLKGPYDRSDDYWYEIGKHIKSAHSWYGNGNGFNDFGFSALPGGFHSNSPDLGYFTSISQYGIFWTSTDHPKFVKDIKYTRRLNYYLPLLENSGLSIGCGLSVRCIKD